MKIQNTTGWEPLPPKPQTLTEFFTGQLPHLPQLRAIAEVGMQPQVRFGTGLEPVILRNSNPLTKLVHSIFSAVVREFQKDSAKTQKILPTFKHFSKLKAWAGLKDALEQRQELKKVSLAISAAMLANLFESDWDGLLLAGHALETEYPPEKFLETWNPFGWQDSFLSTAEYFYARPDEMQELLPLGPLIDFTGLIPPEDEVFKKWGRIIEASLLHRKNDHPDVKWVNWIWEHPAYIEAQEKIRRQERELLLNNIAGKLEAATQERAQAKAKAMQQGQKREAAQGGSSLAAFASELDTRLAVTEEGQKREGMYFEYWQRTARAMPYLRPLMSEFTLNLDRASAMRLSIHRAAIDPYERVLYLNKGSVSGWDLDYIYPLMLLKIALGHHERAGGKDPFLWDKASDILLTGWLQDILPEMPDWVEHFPELEQLPSVEAIYLRLLEWPKKELRKLETMRGLVSSILTEGELSAAEQADRDAALLGRVREGVELANALEGASWGDFGAGLERALRARAARPVPWKPAFAEYLQEITPTPQRERTYAKLSRRIRHCEEPKAGRRRIRQDDAHNLLVIVDTSASMSNDDLEDALGAIRATAAALAINAIRLFACDAQVRDYGWEAPWHAGAQVTLHGGGGTNLDPALRLIAGLTEEGELLPQQPLLIVTDGLFYGEIKTAREHAYLLPKGAALGYKTAAKVFHVAREE